MGESLVNDSSITDKCLKFFSQTDREDPRIKWARDAKLVIGRNCVSNGIVQGALISGHSWSLGWNQSGQGKCEGLVENGI